MALVSACRAAVVLLALQSALAAGAERATNDAPVPSVRTVKERLAGKASDDQRVNNCKVPRELRGPRPRPDACPPGARAAPGE